MVLRIRKSQRGHYGVTRFDTFNAYLLMFRIPIAAIVIELRPATGESGSAAATIIGRQKRDFSF